MTLELGEQVARIRHLKIVSVIRGIRERHGNYYCLFVTNSVLCLFVESCPLSEHQVVIIFPHWPRCW